MTALRAETGARMAWKGTAGRSVYGVLHPLQYRGVQPG